MNIILKKQLTHEKINNITNKIDFIASKLNINNISNKKISYTIDDLLLTFNKFEQKQDKSEQKKDKSEQKQDKFEQKQDKSKQKKDKSEMETLVYELEEEICIKQNILVDNIINDIIKCIQTETPELKKICSNKIKLILTNNNNLNSNIRKKLMLLSDLIINSK